MGSASRRSRRAVGKGPGESRGAGAAGCRCCIALALSSADWWCGHTSVWPARSSKRRTRAARLAHGIAPRSLIRQPPQQRDVMTSAQVVRVRRRKYASRCIPPASVGFRCWFPAAKKSGPFHSSMHSRNHHIRRPGLQRGCWRGSACRSLDLGAAGDAYIALPRSALEAHFLGLFLRAASSSFRDAAGQAGQNTHGLASCQSQGLLGQPTRCPPGHGATP